MKKNSFSRLFAAAAVFAACAVMTVNAAGPPKSGDVNGDGMPDAADASLIISEYTILSTGGTGSFSEEEALAADVNGDTLTDPTDASSILAYYAFLSTGGDKSIAEFLSGEMDAEEPETNAEEPETPTVAQKVQFSKSDLLDPDPETARMAFEELSKNLQRELFAGKWFWGYAGYTSGYPEAQVILAVLNYDKGISPEVLASDNVLGVYSQDDFYSYSIAVADLPKLQEIFGTFVNFNRYVLDDEYADYLTEISNGYRQYKKGNEDLITDIMVNYGLQYDVETYTNIDNYINLYMILKMAHEMTKENDAPTERKLYIENVVRPLYESYAPYIGKTNGG